jgi:F-type H+-transporting ATPase subunit delta
MQISDRVLARRYARALYLSAAEANEQEQTQEELVAAAKKLVLHMAELKNPRVSAADKKSKLDNVIGKTMPRVKRFLELLIEKKRFGLLPYMAADFTALHDEARGIAHAKVRAAHELGEAEKKAIAEKLGTFTGKKIVVDVKVHPELIAGVIVRMGDWVFDASLQGELKRMRGQLAA